MRHRLNSGTQQQAIQRLLRRRGSREFFKGDGWTDNPEEAQTYSDVLEAAETCARNGLSDMELALRLGARSTDLFCMVIR